MDGAMMAFGAMVRNLKARLSTDRLLGGVCLCQRLGSKQLLSSGNLWRGCVMTGGAPIGGVNRGVPQLKAVRSTN